MTNNRKIANSVFNELTKENLIPTNVCFGNGYLIFRKEEDSVVHFHIRGVKGWLFGMWIDISLQDSAIQFFAQYEETIDKFKPSRSTFCERVSRGDLKNIVTNKMEAWWAYFEIIRMVKHIKSNPKLAFVQDTHYSLYLKQPLYKSLISDKLYLYKRRLHKFRKRITDDLFPYCLNNLSAKIVMSWNDELIHDITVVDMNKGEFIFSPRWHVETRYNRISDDDNIQADRMNWLNSRINKFRILFTTVNTSYVDLVPDKSGKYERW